MNLKELKETFLKTNQTSELLGLLEQERKIKIQIKGLNGSSKSLLTNSLFENSRTPILVILNDKEEAVYFYNDLCNLTGNKKVYFFPSSYKRSIKYDQKDNSNIILRTETLEKIQNSTQKIIIVTYPEAIFENIIEKADYGANKIYVKIGDETSIESLHELLEEMEFERVDFVYQPGQYSIRGSIIDVFSFSFRDPVRIDFFGNEIETIRTFNVENQLSKEKLQELTIIPNLTERSNKTASIFEFIHPESKIISVDLYVTINKADALLDYFINEKGVEEEKVITQISTKTALINYLDNHSIVDISNQPYFDSQISFNYNIIPQPAFNKNFDLLISSLADFHEKNIKTIIFSESDRQIERLKSIFNEKAGHVPFDSITISLAEGFIDKDSNLACFTDHQIFNRYHKYKLESNFSKKESLSIEELNRLTPGDYVVHIDHGIGKFGGLARIEANGKYQEAIKLIFKDNDVLFVNIHSLHRISKYKGKEGTPPKVYKLGTGAWQKLKQNTKRKVKDIAKELIELYAKRYSQEGFRYSPDTYMQNELEASFIYEDTPDQLKATKAVKEDMETDVPMDRLVCGDVGFGKTEIAIRAAFKAVADSKQVAILVPTTILAMQHYQTFRERLKDFPCNIDYVSRLKKTKDQKKALAEAKSGQLDILIGTHRIVSKDVEFKDLGLLIIDEEQKFGVALKEKLRKYKLDVDTLTLTATPIPRTLQFSLTGARDLSIINTPPPNRHPIITELHTFNEEIIKEAIYYEIQRNGQVFFVNNRIQNIEETADLINRLCPDVIVEYAHGQMDGSKLEKKMIDFINGEYDVLISTTIIESGLDIPNANTIIINNAQNFGLSDLHQLRGRVGRSNKRAFCYLLAPPLNTLSSEARRRLKALEDFSELGSGFNIALQDLDIRGAGNLLGAEQSGFIADIGFDAYQKILNEAIIELKENDFKELKFEKKGKNEKHSIFSSNIFVSDCQIDTDFEVLFPEDYISNSSERIKLYRELDNIENDEEIEQFKIKLVDRFGEIPQKSIELINIVKLRKIAIRLGMEKILMKNSKLTAHFVSNQQSPFYQSTIFIQLIQIIQQKGGVLKLKEKKDKLMLLVENVENVENALKILDEILTQTQ